MVLSWQGGIDQSALTNNIEAGIALSDRGFGFHRGLRITGENSEVFLRQDHVDTYVGLGVSYLYDLESYNSLAIEGSFCDYNYAVGRPMRDGQSQIQTGEIEWQKTGKRPHLECIAGKQIAKEWGKSAREELDSVPAFLQLAWELMVYGAPASLVERALLAAEDEIRHSIMCTHMAQQYHSSKLLLSPPPNKQRPLLPQKEGIHRLALESWIDGCLGEGYAARYIDWGSRHASHSQTKTILRQIAKDEHKHEQLAWSIVQWALSQDEDGSLREKLSEVPHVPFETNGPFLDPAWEQHCFGKTSTQVQMWESQQKQAQQLLNTKIDSPTA